MKNVVASTSVFAACMLGPSLLAGYNTEVSLGYENLDASFDGEDLYLVGVRAYTQPLTYVGMTPFDEADFFNQVGMVDFVYGRSNGFENYYNTFGLGYTHRSSDTPHAVSVGWVHSDFSSELNAYQTGYQYYLDKGFSVGADVSFADLGDENVWSYGLSSKKLFIFEKNRWLAVDGGVSWTDDAGKGDWTFNTLATYYTSARTGIGVGVSTTDRFHEYETKVSFSQYLRDDLEVNVSYNRGFINDGRDSDGISLGAKFRF